MSAFRRCLGGTYKDVTELRHVVAPDDARFNGLNKVAVVGCLLAGASTHAVKP